MEINSSLQKWLDQLGNFEFQNYEKLPDIDLYMDQVVTFLEKQLAILATSSMDKQITSSMINNYVKGDVISSPISKKYNREHLSLIEEICILKQVLSIAEIKEVIQNRYNGASYTTVFNEFRDMHSKENKEAVEYAKHSISDIKTNDIESLTKLALDMALKANSYITISKRILFLVKLFGDQIKETEEKEKEKKREKDREKEKESD